MKEELKLCVIILSTCASLNFEIVDFWEYLLNNRLNSYKIVQIADLIYIFIVADI